MSAFEPTESPVAAPEIRLNAEQETRLIDSLVVSREIAEGTRLVDYKELAVLLKVSYRRVRTMKDERLIDPIIDDGKTVRFHLPSVWKQLDANRPRRRRLSI